MSDFKAILEPMACECGVVCYLIPTFVFVSTVAQITPATDYTHQLAVVGGHVNAIDNWTDKR